MLRMTTIKAKLALLLLSLVLLTVTLGGMALYVFRDFLRVTEQFMEEKLPRIGTIGQLSELSQRLRAAPPELLQAQDEAELEAVYRRHEQYLRQLGELTAEVSGFQSNQRVLDLNFHSQSLRSNLNVLLRLKLRQLVLEARVERLLNDFFQAAAFNPTPSPSTDARALQILRIQALLDQLFLSHGPQGSPAVTPVAQALADCIAAFRQTTPGPDDPILTLLQQQDPLQLKASLDRLEALLEDPQQRTTLAAQALADETAAYVDEISGEMRSQIGQIRASGASGANHIILLTALGALTALTIGWLLVFRHLGRRLSLLSAAMTLPGADAPVGRVPIEGEDEIAGMARTLESLLERSRELLDTQRMLADALSRAETATRAKSEFLANMSHELRTPLNAILGYAQLLTRDTTLGERQRANLDTIGQSGRHLLTLVNDLLDLSKIEAGKLELYAEPVDLEACFRTLIDILQVKADQKGLALRLALSDRLPAAVLLDEKRLRQVLLNLLGNAVKFTDRGQVTLRVASEPAGDDRVKLTFAVEDTGVGMEPEQLATIFQPFEQVGDIRRRAGGTGLGLAVSRQLICRMGGEVGVCSTPGTGSRFHFALNLPIAERPEAAPGPLPEIVGYRGERRRILIVDDVAANRALLRDTLGMLGFDTQEALDGEEGVNQARAWRPDLILMDVVMPVLDGLEATRRIRQIERLQHTPVIIVSASATDEDLALGRTAGASGFVGKPIERNELLQRIGEQLRLHWETRETETPAAGATAVEEATWSWPSPERLETLHTMALVGDMGDIRRWAEALKAEDPDCRPLADRLIELANAFQSKAILALVEARIQGIAQPPPDEGRPR